MNSKKEIWNHSIDDIVKGYTESEDGYECIVCGRIFERGRIYPENELLYDACGAVRKHVSAEHGNMADYILGQELGLTGLSEVQRQIMQLMSGGKNDKEIASAVGIAQSTVRNHRFKLREKEKQARMFLALTEALEKKTRSRIDISDKGVIEEIHSSATMIDERYGITEQERIKTVKTYMDENGGLKQFPAREKKKIILLREIMKNFKRDVEYTEAEVNRVLKRIYEEDYPGIRRALIEYGFMDRAADCSVYRVKE